jgi:hypothetical protein
MNSESFPAFANGVRVALRPVARGMNEFGVRVLVETRLAGQLVNHDRIRGSREIAHLFGREVVQWMRCHEERQIVELQILGRQMGVREKRGGDDRR